MWPWRRPASEGRGGTASVTDPVGAHVWPLVLDGTTPAGDQVHLRPLGPADESDFHEVRRHNVEWLAPWDATAPQPMPTARRFADMLAHQNAEARAGRALPLGIFCEPGREFVGQVTVSNITRGSFWSCAVGYWVSRAVAGRGIVPTAVALVGDHCLQTLGLHRIEINIRPENAASLAVVRKLGFRDEGERARYLHIDGDWRDHRSFALTIEDLAGQTLLERLTLPSHESLWRHTDPTP